MKLAPALALLLAACTPSTPLTATDFTGIVEQALEVARQEHRESSTAHSDLGGYSELVHAEDRAQGVEFLRGEPRLTLVTLERSPGFERFDRTSATLDAGFAVEAVAARQAFELFVAGVEADGAVVVQRWRIDPRERGRLREELLTVRTTLLRTHEIADVRSMVVDPNGHYLLVLAGDGERLLQIAVQANGFVLASFGADRLPALRAACGVFLGEHVGGSRVIAYEASGSAGVERAVLVDRDRDGTFDELFDGTAEAWAASGFQGPVWTTHRFVTAR